MEQLQALWEANTTKLSLNSEHFALLTGNSHPDLARKISEYLKIPITQMVVDQFSNGEIHVQIHENIRKKNVIIVQTGLSDPEHNFSVNDAIMELLVIANACKLSSAESITAVVPNYPYARQDKKDVSRAPISGRLVADLMEAAGITRIICLDLHAPQIAGFFSKPVDNLYAVNLMAEDIKQSYLSNHLEENYVLVSPDAGGMKRMDALAAKVSLETVIMHKKRNHTQKSMVLNTILVGEEGCVKDKVCIIVDDICDTAGTVCKASETLIQNGAKSVILIMVHGILSGPAIDRINANDFIREVVVTNSLPQDQNQARCPKLRIIDIAPLLGETVRRIYTGDSISSLFH